MATGNGQAAVALAGHFERVLATDASPSQLRHAEPHSRVTYRVAVAGHDADPPRDVDLVTVAQALHWLDRPRFFEEARGALRPRGLLAVWTYALCRIDEAVDAVVRRLHHELLRGWWTPDRAMVDEGYRSIEFPFRELHPPAIAMTSRWDLARFRGYLDTWSAVRRFQRERGRDPLEEIGPALEDAWGEPTQVREVTWPLTMRVGVRD